MNDLLSSGLWPRMRKLAKGAKKKYAAIAYVTDDRFVKFGKGDILITDASDVAITSGQTSAAVLRAAWKRNAQIVSITGLHAKVYVFDKNAIIGSANLSKTSERRTEAALLTDHAAGAVEVSHCWKRASNDGTVRKTRSIQMDFSEEEIRDAANAQELIRKKLLEIMDLQADIDGLLRDEHPTPFGSAKWKSARPEVLQRLVLMTAVQFVLLEPLDWVEGNDKFKAAGEDVINLLSGQLKWLKKKYSQ